MRSCGVRQSAPTDTTADAAPIASAKRCGSWVLPVPLMPCNRCRRVAASPPRKHRRSTGSSEDWGWWRGGGPDPGDQLGQVRRLVVEVLACLVELAVHA